MKTALLTVAVLEFQCPECGEMLTNPATGSHLFTVGDTPLPKTLRCGGWLCETVVEVPAKAFRIEAER